MKKILLLASVLLVVAANSAEKPEISWSIMHPTGIDVKYSSGVKRKPLRVEPKDPGSQAIHLAAGNAILVK